MSLADRLTDLVTPVIKQDGFRLWDLKVTKAGKRSVVSVLLDKDGGAGADELAEMSKTIAPILDEDPSLDDAYHLEVATPGLERNLSTPEHFMWSIGMDITVSYRKDGSINRTTGKLASFDETTNEIVIEEESDSKTIALDTITKSHTLFDFQAAMKKAEQEDIIPQGETA